MDVYTNNKAMWGPYASKQTSPESRLLLCKSYERLLLSSWWVVREIDSCAAGRIQIEPCTPADEDAMQ